MSVTGTAQTTTTSTITKAEVHQVILQRLKDHGADINDIDEELRSVLYDISSRDDFLPTTGTITTADGTSSYDEPSLCRRIVDIARSGGNKLKRISFDHYQRTIENSSSISTGEPLRYALFNNDVYVYPEPDDTYSFTVYYYKFHGNDLTAIEFNGRFREAIYSGVLALLWQGQLSANQQAGNLYGLNNQRYEEEISKRQHAIKREIKLIKYNEI